MKTQRQNDSEGLLAISKPNKKPSNSMNCERNSLDSIPRDLIVEIFTRLHVKSIARCRCVSKVWSSILASPHFTDLFMTRSIAHPKLLFACKKKNRFFLSSPQLQIPDDKSSHVSVDYHIKFPGDGFTEVYDSVSGLVCLKTIKEVLVIYNPSTGQSLTLPKVNTTKANVVTYFGYDPIDKQFKVLSMPVNFRSPDKKYMEHHILTLGNGEHSWRMIKYFLSHTPLYGAVGICINGLLYYEAADSQNNEKIWKLGVACFDIRSEKYKFFIEKPKGERGKLVNYKGKLSILKLVAGNLELSILEDDTWSTHTYVLLPLLRDDNGIDAKFMFFRKYIVGVTRLGEIVLSLRSTPYLFYYNIERNTLINVEIQGMDVPGYEITTFLDHVEDMKLGGMFKTS